MQRLQKWCEVDRVGLSRFSVEAGEQALGDAGIGDIFCAEGLMQGGFFDVDAVEDSGGAGRENYGEAEPIAGMQADGEEDEQQAEIGRMTNEAIKAGAIEFLRIEDSDVGTEGFAESEDSGPADG